MAEQGTPDRGNGQRIEIKMKCCTEKSETSITQRMENPLRRMSLYQAHCTKVSKWFDLTIFKKYFSVCTVH